MTGTDFTPGNLGGQVAAQLARYGRGATLAGPNAMTPAATHSPATAGGRPATFGHMAVSDLAGCVNRIAAGDLVLLVDVARYRGVAGHGYRHEGACGRPGADMGGRPGVLGVTQRRAEARGAERRRLTRRTGESQRPQNC